MAARIRLFDDRDTPWSLATVIETWIPVNGEDTYVGHGGPGGAARLNMATALRIRSVSLNVGYNVRPKSDFGGVKVDDEIAMGLGTHVRLGSNAIVAEGRLATDAFSPFGEPSGPAGELNTAYRHTVGHSHGLTLGAGLGLLPGLGTPLWRGFLGYSLLGSSAMSSSAEVTSNAGLLEPAVGIQPTVVVPGDIDRDGILNATTSVPILLKIATVLSTLMAVQSLTMISTMFSTHETRPPIFRRTGMVTVIAMVPQNSTTMATVWQMLLIAVRVNREPAMVAQEAQWIGVENSPGRPARNR